VDTVTEAAIGPSGTSRVREPIMLINIGRAQPPRKRLDTHSLSAIWRLYGRIALAAAALAIAVLFSPTVWAACPATANQVAFFMDANFKGKCVIKDVGEYPNAEAIGLPNDSISSVQVGSNVQVVLCKDTNFGGDCILLRTSSSFLNGPQVGNDQVTSAKVQLAGTTACEPGNNQASFFTNANYLGSCVIKGVGVFPNARAIGLPNDSISSVRVGRNAQVVLCKDTNFGGDCILLRTSSSFLHGPRVGNDQVTSAKVQLAGTTECEPGHDQVAFFMHADFLAPCGVVGIGKYISINHSIGLPNDSVSSIKVGADVRACAYHGSGVTTYVNNTAFLADQNDTIETALVLNRGSSCPEAVDPQPFIFAGIEPVPPPTTGAVLRIGGQHFTAKVISLQITTTGGGDPPSTQIIKTPTGGGGTFDFIYTGSGGGVCDRKRIFQVQATDSADMNPTGIQSNVANAGC
jgi:hypothetical protein